MVDVSKWLGCAPIAHAHTILIAARKGDLFMLFWDTYSQNAPPGEQEAFIWSSAWEFLQGAHYVPAADINLECLAALEERMYENSARVGVAGNQQWGLDKGDHQGKWGPYIGLPAHWNHEDRDEHDSEVELQVCDRASLQ